MGYPGYKKEKKRKEHAVFLMPRWNVYTTNVNCIIVFLCFFSGVLGYNEDFGNRYLAHSQRSNAQMQLESNTLQIVGGGMEWRRWKRNRKKKACGFGPSDQPTIAKNNVGYMFPFKGCKWDGFGLEP